MVLHTLKLLFVLLLWGIFRMGHYCKGREWSDESAFWVNDAQGIPLAKVCVDCEDEKLSGYRPEILTGYDQSDVDEPIDPEDLYDW